ncbi:MAG: SPOR domain-containing protein [Vicingaceae bacterium]|nr:SPOR domain-containing protein [Vicingaceae bacterium]
MKIEQYISELLYQYDCVIVPGLGGFIANYKPATIQPIQNTFSPPSKSISFNKNLNNNDGLLANFIAQKEAFSFDFASKKIEDYVGKINRELRLKKSVTLAAVGNLFLDSENRLQFEPANTSNYLLESYGLPVYQKQPIKRITIEEKITKEFVDRTTPLVAVKGQENRKSKKWMYSAALVFLAFGAGFMANNSNLSGDLNYANLNPFTPSAKAVYTPFQYDLTISETTTSTVEEQINAANENSIFVEVTLDEKENLFVVQLKEKTVAEPVSTYVAETKKVLQYHIIGGCFSEKRNAKKMVKKLKKQGFDAFVVGKRKGLWAVSYNSFVTRKEALNALENAQAHNDKAWILDQSF